MSVVFPLLSMSGLATGKEMSVGVGEMGGWFIWFLEQLEELRVEVEIVETLRVSAALEAIQATGKRKVNNEIRN
jgi:hypothetical protein